MGYFRRRRERLQAGRVARLIVAREARQVLRRHWWLFLVAAVAPLVVFGVINWIWAQFFTIRPVWVAFGWGLMIGLMFGVVALLLAEFGLHRRLTGADAERWSAAQLQKLGSGWRVINDIPTGFGNVDHVVVGESVVLAVETKVADDNPWLEESLIRACRQSERGADRIRLILLADGIDDIQIVPCVLRWGIGVGSSQAVRQLNGVTVLSAAHDDEWRERISAKYSGRESNLSVVRAIEDYAEPRRHHEARAARSSDR